MSEIEKAVPNGTNTLKKRAMRWALYLLLLLLAAAGGYLLVCNYTYSEGTRIGYVMKISKKGMLLKTFEGTLNLATRNDLAVKTWDFSAVNRKVYTQIADSEGRRVKLYYKQKLKVMPWQGDTPYLVYQVQAVKE